MRIGRPITRGSFNLPFGRCRADSSRQSCGQANDIHGSADSEVITINPSEMKTHTLEKWLDHLRRNPDLADWVVTKVNHMKNFQYSPVFHEFLKVTVKPTYMSTEEHIIIIERMVDQDQVTFGWQPVDYVLTKWWLVRLLRGHYSGSKHGRLAMISSSTDRPEWRATGYSGSDYLCHLEFNPGIRLMDFTESAQEISNRLGKYDAIKRNCYEFASQLYSRWNPEERGQMMSSKVQHKKGGYYNHKSKFALLPLLGSKSVSSFLMWRNYQKQLTKWSRIISFFKYLIYCSRLAQNGELF